MGLVKIDYKKLIKQEFKKLLEDSKIRTITIKVPSEKYINIRPFKSLFNKFIIQISRKIIPSNFKNRWMRLAGLDIGYDVCLPNDIIFDAYFITS